MFRSFAFIIVLSLAAVALPALAQDNPDSDSDVPSAARQSVRIAQLEEQMRRMEGAIEQLSYENKQLKAQLDKAGSDTQYRLQALESKQAPAVAPVATPPAAPDTSNQLQPVPPASEGDIPPDTGDNPAPAAAPAVEQFANSRDHYNYAFRLMNQAKYAEAGASFADFTRRYPHDPLIGNAFYWLGETYYVRRDYPRAADNFRQGYEAMPSGPKAGDNLLNLAMSLDAMKKDTEACVVLKQVTSKFAGGSVRPRAEQEMNRIGCN